MWYMDMMQANLMRTSRIFGAASTLIPRPAVGMAIISRPALMLIAVSRLGMVTPIPLLVRYLTRSTAPLMSLSLS